MSRKKLIRNNFVQFEEVWKRIVAETTIRKFKELAEIASISPSAVTTRSKKNEFPIEWGFFVAQEFGLNTDWLLTGEGEKKANQKDFLAEVEDWISDVDRTNQDFKIWFKVQFENKFPEFMEWKKRKEERPEQHNIPGFSNVA